MVTEHAVRLPRLDQTLHPFYHGGPIGPPVGQVPGNHQPPLARMGTVLGVAKPTEQGTERLDFTMDIPTMSSGPSGSGWTSWVNALGSLSDNQSHGKRGNECSRWRAGRSVCVMRVIDRKPASWHTILCSGHCVH